jgi:hypothetical protein
MGGKRIRRTDGAMNYQTVFDLSSAGFRFWPGPAIGVLLLLAGGGLIAFSARMPRLSSRFLHHAFPLVFFGFAAIWTSVTTVSIFREYREISTALKENRLQQVEGTVTDFRPMPYTAHTMEHFCVRNVCFAYSDYVHTFGFHNTMSYGGPIRNGLGVRVAYVGNIIVRLDVAVPAAGRRGKTTFGG